jgi:UDP-2,3-diacylglucosamine pyrophosphatase LpxH
MTEDRPNRYRSLFISDVHLGTKAAQADMLLDLLKKTDCEAIYLVGDIIDGWRLKTGWFWPQAHNDVVQKLLRKARKGARVVYIPGNHDEFARDYLDHTFGGVEVVDRAIHRTADGRRFLVIHGDQFDVVVRHARWIALLGDWAYETALKFNALFNVLRRRLGFGYWSFSAWAKLKVKNAVNFIGDFETTLAQEAERAGVDGVICGHIHHAAIRRIGTIDYVNTGDFVESCTAVVEHFDGRLEILRWSEIVAADAAVRFQQHGERAAA